MSLRRYPARLLVAAALSSLLILGLSGSLAVYLEREQARTAEVHGEDIGSRRAADLALLLEREALPACVQLVKFNAGQIEESERAHRQALRQMTWGLALVG